MEDSTARRRDNSVSGIKSAANLSRNEPEEESFIGNSNGISVNARRPANESFSFEAPKPRRATSRPTREEREPLFDEEEKKSGVVPVLKMLTSMIALGVVVAITFSFYKSYLNGQVPRVLQSWLPARTSPISPNKKEENRDPAKQSLPVNDPSDPNSGENGPDGRSSNECFLKVESDPASATVWIGSASKGTTPTIIPLECGANYNVTLRKDGYEGVSENIVMRKAKNPQGLFKTLKSIPVGTLVFRVTLNSTVTIDEIKFEKYVTLNDVVEVALPAGRRIRVKFSNPVYDINSGQDVLVQDNERLEKTFRLERNSK